MVYVLLADGFEEIEALEPIDIMRRSGIEVKTVSITKERAVVGAHKITVVADILSSDLIPEEMEMLILPGGSGHETLDASNYVHALINFALENRIYIAAICAAPSILGKKMLYEGKRATCYPGFEKYLYGAEISADKVVRDGLFITGKGAGAAAEFGFMIVSVLKDQSTANKVREMMQY